MTKTQLRLSNVFIGGAFINLAFLFGVVAGTAAADPIANAAARQHNAQVIATTEAAAKNYSVVPTGDANLRDPNRSYVSMFDLDESYRN